MNHPGQHPRFDTHAQQVIRQLLDADDPVEVDYELLGPWGQSIEALADAHRQGGADAARKVFGVPVRREPGLLYLMAGTVPSLKTIWTLAELYATHFPPPAFVVDNLLPHGLTILAGRPKLGKSWLALQIAGAVGSGGEVLGRPVTRGKVLYLALEDTARRLRDRAK